MTDNLIGLICKAAELGPHLAALANQVHVTSYGAALAFTSYGAALALHEIKHLDFTV